MEVKEKKTEPMQAAVIKYVGPYSEAAKLYGEICGWLMKKRLQITGPPFGWFYDNPQETEASKLKGDVGVPFKGEAKAEGRITIRQVPSQEVVYTIHKGPYGEVGPSYQALFQYTNEKGYIPLGCPMEIYLNDPAKVLESEYVTEIQQPIRKR